MGKGTIGINPFHSDRSLMSKTAVAGLLATLIAFTEAKDCKLKFPSSRLSLVSSPSLTRLPIRSLSNVVILDKSHWMIYFLVSAMYPRFFITLDEELKSQQVTTRVGLVRRALLSFSSFLSPCSFADSSRSLSFRLLLFSQAVDVVGQAGKPRGISGFVTHQTPVRIGTTERAELATEEFFSYSHVLEGLVVLHKNEVRPKSRASNSTSSSRSRGRT